MTSEGLGEIKAKDKDGFISQILALAVEMSFACSLTF